MTLNRFVDGKWPSQFEAGGHKYNRISMGFESGQPGRSTCVEISNRNGGSGGGVSVANTRVGPVAIRDGAVSSGCPANAPEL